MAYPDLSDLQSRLRSLLDEASTRFYSDAQITRWLNDGERDLAAKALCIEDIVAKTTTASTRTVGAYYVKVLAAEYQPGSGTRVGMTKITPRYLGHVTTNGVTPQYWFSWGPIVGIEPIPNTTYTVNLYVAKLPSIEMSTSTDEPEVPAEFRPLIVRHAFVRGLMRDSLYASAASVYQDYILEVSKIRRDIIEKYADIRGADVLPDIIQEVTQ